MVSRGAVLGMMVLCLCGAGWGQVVDLTKPFEVDKDTLALYPLDNVGTGEVKDAVEGGKTGKVGDATEAEGKFGKAVSFDGAKGWVDFEELRGVETLSGLTVECWVKFKDLARGDIVTRNSSYMIRVNGTVQAYIAVDGKWRIVKGSKEVPRGTWTHLAITYDQKTKEIRIYVNGQLDKAEVPADLTDGNVAFKGSLLRLGTNDWQPVNGQMGGELDEVRISSTARIYEPLKTEEPKTDK